MSSTEQMLEIATEILKIKDHINELKMKVAKLESENHFLEISLKGISAICDLKEHPQQLASINQMAKEALKSNPSST